jgi:CCR4-NOT transcription complex subunit 3
MERFKACEKEMKTKAFSKEGLNASTKLDPKLVEKMETMQWIQEKVESLQQQVELTEAEIESLHAGGKKKKASSTTERVEALEHLNERRKWHIGRLELILRLLDNGTLKADKVKDLQEDVTYFVDSNAVSTRVLVFALSR